MNAVLCTQTSPSKTKITKEQELLSVTEFCQLAGFSRGTFWRLRKAEQLPALFKIRGKNYVRTADFHAWLEGFRV